jgi:NADH-quinone oxidoreductase subunit F
MKHLTERIHHGQGNWDDVILLADVANGIKGKCLCALGDFATEAVSSSITRFKSDFELKTRVAPVNIEAKVAN